MELEDKNLVESVAEIVKSIGRVERVENIPLLVNGLGNFEILDDLLQMPRRQNQVLTIESLESLKQALEIYGRVAGDEGVDQQDGTTVVFASRDSSAGGRMVAIFDYHHGVDAAWGASRAEFSLEYDPRFAVWNKTFDSWLSQADFAELIDRNENALVDPTAAKMLEVAQSLEFNIKSKVTSKRNITSGAFELEFSSDEGGDSSTVIPERITLGLPIFKGLLNEDGKRVAHKVEVKVRRRIREGSVLFQLAPVNLDDIVDDAWADAVAQVKNWDLAPVLEGSAS